MWAIGMWAPLPAPIPVILRVIGAVLFFAGILFLILGLINAGTTTDVDVDGMRALLLL